LARDLGQPDLIARSLNIIAYNLLMLGRVDDVEARAEEARALFATLGNRAMETDCLSIVAIIRIHTGRLQAGIDAARAGVAIGRAIENPWGVANCAYNFAQGLFDRGEWNEALEVAQDGVAAARAAGHPPTLVFNLLALGRAYRSLFALDRARQLHQEARAIAEALRHPLLLEWTAIELCADCAIAEDWDAAHGYARQALSIRNYGRVYVGFTRWCETEALLRGDDAAQAGEDVRRMQEQLLGMPRIELQHRRCLALLAESAGDTRQAIIDLEVAGDLADTIGLLDERWRIDAALGEHYLSVGDAAPARQAFTRAGDRVRALAEQLQDETLRVSFLAAAPVRRVLEA
jgi:tetratricopeptide (TPR) repeat protein